MRRFFFGPLLLCVAGCSRQPLPGTLLGKFDVVGTATTDTCGAGLNAPNPWKFTVELSKDDALLFWSWLDDQPASSGALDANGNATITASQTDGADGGVCTMDRDDTLSVTLGSDSPPTSFTGTLTYAFKAVDGAVCDGQLAANGGMYDTVPCTITYSLAGTKK